jgi:hypothetical protein
MQPLSTADGPFCTVSPAKVGALIAQIEMGRLARSPAES